MKRRLTCAALLVLIAGAAGLGGAGSAEASLSGVHWLVSGIALNEISNLNPSLAQTAFDNSLADVIRDGSTGVPTGWTSVPVADYKSYAKLSSDMASGHFPSGVHVVLYDDEHWSYTPLAEQQNPGKYIALAAQLCHQHGLALIAAPAVDLTAVLSPRARDRYQAYLNLGLAATAGKSADVVDIQGQDLEAGASAYQAFVSAAAQQARKAGAPSLIVLAGLSTGPNGSTVTANQLTHAATAVRGTADGYWLNVPGPSPYCPNCAPARPDLAVALLNALQHS